MFPFEVSGWQLGLVGFAAVQAVYLYRYRSLQFLAGVLLAAHLAWGGVGIGASLAAVGNNAVEPLALFALFGYGVWRRSHPVLLAAALGLGALFTARLELLGSSLDAVLALDLVGLGGLIWSKRVHGNGEAGARARFAAVFLLFVPVAALDLVESGGALGDASQLLSWGTVLALLVPAAVTRLRVYAFPALILPIQGAVALAPSSSVGWGLAGMIGAFALVSLGVFVSLRREQILAWLEDSSISDFEEGEPFLSTPASDTGWRHVVLAAGLLSAVGWVVLPVL